MKASCAHIVFFVSFLMSNLYLCFGGSCSYNSGKCIVEIVAADGAKSSINLKKYEKDITSDSSYDARTYHFQPCGTISDISPCSGYKGCQNEDYPMGDDDGSVRPETVCQSVRLASKFLVSDLQAG